MRAADRKQSKYYKSRKKQFNNRQKGKVDHVAMSGRLWRRRASQQEPSVAAHFKDAAHTSGLARRRAFKPEGQITETLYSR